MTASLPAYTYRQGSAPLLVSMPHVGTLIPPHIAADMTDAALRLADTDWHLEILYDCLEELGASVLVATHSRYVIDVNRPPDNANLYPGQDTTGLCPVDTFAREPLYQAGKEPNEQKIAARREQIWQPYHNKLAEELQRMREQHGVAMLWDAHSIASEVPRFFSGRLPDFNIGTAAGTSCAEDLSHQLTIIAQSMALFSHALNGRFKGGHITRHYGDPANHVHAVQLELSQITYMEETYPFRFDPQVAQQVQPILRRFLQTMLHWAETAR